jgi:hypothetical protein
MDALANNLEINDVPFVVTSVFRAVGKVTIKQYQTEINNENKTRQRTFFMGKGYPITTRVFSTSC